MRRLVTLVLPAVFIAAAHGQDAADPPRYGLKDTETHVGTNIPREIVRGSAVPLDKTWSEFTPEEKAIVRARYERMAPDDEPPWPVAGLGVVYRHISVVQRRLRIRDDISLLVEVGPDGNARSVGSLRQSDPELVKAIANVLMLEKFKPAVCKGEPCVMQFPVRLTFHL